MLLKELFKEPKDSDFKWHQKKSDMWQGSFSTGEAYFEMTINKWGFGDEWDIEFRAYESEPTPAKNSSEPQTGIVGNKQQFKVFAIVIPRIKEFIDKNKPSKISFSAKEKSREKLYNKMIGRFASKWGYKVLSGNGEYELVRK